MQNLFSLIARDSGPVPDCSTANVSRLEDNVAAAGIKLAGGEFSRLGAISG